MLTVEQLQAFGANTEVGIARCAKREALYLRLVKTIPVDPSFDKLGKALDDKDLALWRTFRLRPFKSRSKR